MSLGVSLVTFSNGTTIFSEEVNSNFVAVNNATRFTMDNALGVIVANTGAGAVTCQANAAIIFSNGGSIGGLTSFSGSGVGSFSHGLNAIPHLVGPDYAGSFGTAPTSVAYSYNYTSTTCQVVGQVGYSWVAIAYRHG